MVNYMKNKEEDFYVRKDIRKLIQRNQNPIWKRVFAYVIDILILQFIVNIIFYNKIKYIKYDNLSIADLYKAIELTPESKHVLIMMGIMLTILSLVYFTLLEFKYRQTLGKMLFKIKVRSYSKKITLLQAFIRNIPKSLMFISYLNTIFIIDLFFLIFSGARLFERLSRTYVSKT